MASQILKVVCIPPHIFLRQITPSPYSSPPHIFDRMALNIICMVSFAGEKLYHCTEEGCDQGFINNAQLQLHIRSGAIVILLRTIH